MRLIILFVLALLVAPSASAGPFDRIEIIPPVPRVGDLVHLVMSPDGDVPGAEIVLHVEGEARTTDRYAIERDTIAVRVDSYDHSAFERADRCHFLKGGREVVRSELLAGEGYGSSANGDSTSPDPLAGQTTFWENSTGVVLFGNGPNCYYAGATYREPRAFREGESVRFADLVEDHGGAPDVLSEPGEETTFHGRRALLFGFGMDGKSVEEPELWIDIVVAEGIPGIARATIETPERRETWQETRGFTAGTGAPLALWGSETIPNESPLTSFVDYDPLLLHDEGLPVPFPYRDAFQAMIDDPNSGAASWLDAHPDAFLSRAAAEPTTGTESASPIGASGSWSLSFRGGSTVASWIVERGDHVDGPLGRVALPLPTYSVMSLGTYEEPWAAPPAPARVLSGAGVATLARQAGLGELAPRLSFSFREAGEGLPDHILEVTDVARGAEDDEGHTLRIDTEGGALMTVLATRYRAEVSNGLLPDVDPIEASDVEANGIELLARPTPLAVGAASLALAALVVALRFLFPLYTRLRRDRLLEHPVRGRLYDRIRAEPGIHLAALEALEGVGKGGTKRHLDVLARHKLVFAIEEPHFLRYFAAGDVPFDAARQRGLLRSGSHEKVYALYHARPEASLREAARELGLSAPSVHRAKKKLEKAGLLAPAAHLVPATVSRMP